jgi:hypothetical protein
MRKVILGGCVLTTLYYATLASYHRSWGVTYIQGLFFFFLVLRLSLEVNFLIGKRSYQEDRYIGTMGMDEGTGFFAEA